MSRVFFSVSLAVAFCGIVSEGRCQEQPDGLAKAQQEHGLRCDQPLLMRVGVTPESVVKIFRDAGMTPSQHTLTDDERHSLSQAIDSLPPLHQRILQQRLRSISFVDNMPNTALTSTVNPEEPDRLFDITIRAGILEQSASEWVSEKEGSCFDWMNSESSLEADVGNISAIQYVLIHEATHVVDATLDITPSLRSEPADEKPNHATPFTLGYWVDSRNPVDRYRNELLMSIRFRREGKVKPAETAKDVYRALGRTPFVSLYGSSARTEDLAEFVTVYHLTQKLGQPFRIRLFDDKNEILVYEPASNERVRARFELMDQFYESSIDAIDGK